MKVSKFYRIEYSFCYENDDDTVLVGHGWNIRPASFSDGVADETQEQFEQFWSKSAANSWLSLLKHAYKLDLEPIQRAPLTCRSHIQKQLSKSELSEYDPTIWEDLTTEFSEVEKRWMATKVLKQKCEWDQKSDPSELRNHSYA